MEAVSYGIASFYGLHNELYAAQQKKPPHTRRLFELSHSGCSFQQHFRGHDAAIHIHFDEVDAWGLSA